MTQYKGTIPNWLRPKLGRPQKKIEKRDWATSKFNESLQQQLQNKTLLKSCERLLLGTFWTRTL